MEESTSSSTTTLTTTAAIALLTYATYQYLTYDHRWWWKKRSSQTGSEVCHQPDWENQLIHGHVSPGWERVRDEFIQNFRVRGELGAAICVYHRGMKVVDLWGGYAHRESKTPWVEDTMVPIFSSTKGVSAMALYMLASRGLIDLEEKVVTYWPEFGVNGKEDVTCMELIDHSVGLAGITPPITLEMLQRKDSHNAVRDHIAAAKMEWNSPGDKKGYMATMLGFYESALVELTDPSGRTIGKYLHDEAFTPLGISEEVYIGLPDSVPSSRVARIDGMAGLEGLWPTGSFPDGFMKKILTQPNSYTGRSFRNPQISSAPGMMDFDRRDVQAVEMPASGGVGTPRAVATMYRAAERAINGNDNKVDNPLGLDRKVLAHLTEPAKPGRMNGWIDEVLGVEVCMGAGMVLPMPLKLIGTSAARTHDGGGRFICTPGRSSFGTFGAGGSFGFCDLHAEIAFSYAPNRCGQLVFDDPREFALRDKVYEAVWSICRKEGRSGVSGDGLEPLPHYLSKRYMEAHPELSPLH